MRIASVVGARPQFIKAAMVGAALREAGHVELLIHTGQHFDANMSDVFFEELDLPAPSVNLGVGSGSHADQTAAMLTRIEAYLVAERPDLLMVFGDTNSTLAGSLAAAKLGIPVAHVEAGLRSFNRAMPEEHNRILTDHLSSYLFCPTETAVRNLTAEGVTDGVHLVGDPMYDAVLVYAAKARASSTILKDLDLGPGDYALCTIHRPYNTDDPRHLGDLLRGLVSLPDPVVFPVHPRTRARIEELDPEWPGRLEDAGARLLPPLGYLDLLRLQEGARVVMTDSGGVQKEAYFLGVPCITLRPETEWVETLDGGWNTLLGEDRGRLQDLYQNLQIPRGPRGAFGDGRASRHIAACFDRELPRPPTTEPV